MTKLDRMDIKCVRDYSPLSNAELMAEIEFYVGVAFDSPLRDPDPEEVLGPARALFDRAEAAETERNTAARRAFNAEAENQRLQRELSAAVTRVAELKADYAEENRLHAEAEARAAELEGVNGEFYRLGAGGDPAP